MVHPFSASIRMLDFICSQVPVLNFEIAGTQALPLNLIFAVTQERVSDCHLPFRKHVRSTLTSPGIEAFEHLNSSVKLDSFKQRYVSSFSSSSDPQERPTDAHSSVRRRLMCSAAAPHEVNR